MMMMMMMLLFVVVVGDSCMDDKEVLRAHAYTITGMFHLPAGAAAEVAAEMFASHERGRRCEPVGPDDLGPYATRAIQTWFKEDFENLGYSTDVADWREPPTRRIGP